MARDPAPSIIQTVKGAYTRGSLRIKPPKPIQVVT